MKNMTINSVDFTLLASEKLSEMETDIERQQMVRSGNQQVINEIFQEILDRPHTLGHFLKRYIADVTYQEYDDISDEELMTFIKHAFKDNHMKNIGSLTPGVTTTLSQRLKSWLDSPITGVDRQTIFLFCFGLNMDEEAASYLLTKTFRTNDFYIRDPNEAIYYYCLKHNIQYPEMLNWLTCYDEISVESENTEYKSTSMLHDAFFDFQYSFERDDEGFLEYLKTLKNLPSEKKKNRFSHFENFKCLMSGVESALCQKCNLELLNVPLVVHHFSCNVSAENVDTLLKIAPHDDIIIPENIKLLIDRKLIRFPSFSVSYLKKRLEDRRDPITRTDILIAAFLLCTAENDFSDFPPDIRYINRRIDFEETVNNYLEFCEYGELYLLNPLELLLVFCLYQDCPFEYFITLWRYSKDKELDHRRNL